MKTNRLKRIWILAIGAVLLASCGGATKVADATNIGSSAEPIEAQSTVPQPKAGETIIVDVRTVAEWDNDGHANCTVNIPIDELESRMGELKKDQKVILVCRSGNRAGRAKQLLESAGFTQVENKGAWQNVECK
ncbi:MAG: rhodanese-like domain-containing protein [Sphingomonadales bacterium]|nr:rhodanese-like domain-containing protein [Sphingomonadales bacterium]